MAIAESKCAELGVALYLDVHFQITKLGREFVYFLSGV